VHIEGVSQLCGGKQAHAQNASADLGVSGFKVMGDDPQSSPVVSILK